MPDLHDFVAGIAAILKPNGLATIEFHVLRTISEVQFDQIYHEHFSYSLLALERSSPAWAARVRCRRVADPWWFAAAARRGAVIGCA